MINPRKNLQILLVFILFSGLSPVVSIASQSSKNDSKQVKKYACPWRGCSRGFNYESELARHLRTHTKQKPFQCEECSKGFTRRSHLARHVITHTRKKPFQCEECSKGFTRRRLLTEHIRTHTGEKPFQCKECGKKFSLKQNLKRHLKRKTPCKPSRPSPATFVASPSKIAELTATLREICNHQEDSELWFPELPSLLPVQDQAESVSNEESCLQQPLQSDVHIEDLLPGDRIDFLSDVHFQGEDDLQLD